MRYMGGRSMGARSGFAGPALSYLICATPRSGSTLLCAALDDTGIAGHPEEHFEILLETGHARQPRDYFQRSNDPEVWALLDDPEFRDVLGEYGGRYSEHPARRDPLWRPPDFERLVEGALHKGTTRQAVSQWKALQTQQWRKDSDEDVSAGGLRFSFAAVDHLKLRIDEHNAAWQDFFEGCGVEPMEVVYEELVEDYRGTLLWLLDGIGISVPENFAVAEPKMRRQADELSEEWVRLYDEGAAAKTVQKG